MHSSCYEWIGGIVTEYGLAEKSTIEIGSGVVNGSIRDHWKGPYVGVDLFPGNGVDRTENSEALSDSNATFECVVSAEMLEHVSRPWLAMNEMARIAKKGAHVIVTARGYDSRGCWQVHGYPGDVTRFSDVGMRVMAEDAGLEVLECSADPEGPGWFLHCVKN